MNITDSRIDNGKAFDWGRVSEDYAPLKIQTTLIIHLILLQPVHAFSILTMKKLFQILHKY